MWIPFLDKYPWLSSYNYVLNNPIGIVDPDGKDTISTRAVGIYDHKTNTETVVETVVNELGNAGNPANGNTTLTTTNVATILPNGEVSVSSTTISSNPLRGDITSSIPNGGVKLLTKDMQKYVSSSANLMRSTGMGSIRTMTPEFNKARQKQIYMELGFNALSTVVFGAITGVPRTIILASTAGVSNGYSFAEIHKGFDKLVNFVPISTNKNITQRLK